jgi:hypothetical protein
MNNLEKNISAHKVEITFSCHGLIYKFYWEAVYKVLYTEIYKYYRKSTELARIDSMATENVETKNKAIELINNCCKEQEIPYQI